ncbi:MAG: ribonuclease Y [Chloroflexi bacterium]|nr:ribonuclease Y [Chloroflexota bacterium]
MDVVIPIVVALACLVVGAAGGYYGKRIVSRQAKDSAEQEATRILGTAKEQERALLLEAKEEALRVRSSAELELKERRSETQRTERRLANREESLENRSSNLDRRERKFSEREKEQEDKQKQLEELTAQEVKRLESIAELSLEEAKSTLLQRADEEIQHELAVLYRDHEEQVRSDANDKAKNIIAEAIQRLASEVVSEATVTTVPLPNDDMKGRLIGREGRNIRAIEKATGVDLIIDDTPEAVTLSCFDPIRREIARLTLVKLMSDGRIHPARIEDTITKAEKEVWDVIRKAGESAVFDTGSRGMSPEIVKLLGRLKYRYSYGENVLQHSIEVAHIAATIAAELGANIKVAKTGGLLHDIGKALTHEVEGPHAEIGAEVAAKHGVPPAVVATIAEHHSDNMSSIESFIVAAADAVSAARPGARRDTVENYVKRLEALEDVGKAFEGVEKCYAIQAGREMRVLVKPEDITDEAATLMARDIVKKIEETLVYPGQIKVTVIRESRATEFAR